MMFGTKWPSMTSKEVHDKHMLECGVIGMIDN